MPRVLSSTLALYRLLLLVYPSAFRRTFGDELVRDMDAAALECWRAARWRGLAALWARTLGDLVVSAAVQWTRVGWPFASWLVGIATMAALGVSWHVYRAAWDRARTFADDEIAVLLVAISAVLVVVVCTLTFTMWFARPRRRARS